VKLGVHINFVKLGGRGGEFDALDDGFGHVRRLYLPAFSASIHSR
jgi:hypothetical protein